MFWYLCYASSTQVMPQGCPSILAMLPKVIGKPPQDPQGFPKTPQRPPQTSPKGFPNTLQDHVASQNLPEVSQRLPKGLPRVPQGLPKVAPSFPKPYPRLPQGLPGGSPRCSQGFFVMFRMHLKEVSMTYLIGNAFSDTSLWAIYLLFLSKRPNFF